MYAKELRRQLRAEAAGRLPALLAALPEEMGREICAGLGWLGFWWVARDRRLARANLEQVYPEWPARRVEQTARAVFKELGRNVYDFLRYPQLSDTARRDLIQLEGRGVLDELHQSGRGAVIVTGHFGAWEILAARLVAEGYPFKAMARPIRERRLEDLLSRHRERMGVRTFASSRGPLAPVRHLREGGFLGVLMDQRVKSGGTVVRFLGRPTRMTEAPARLALATGTPLVAVAVRRLAGHRHRARVWAPLEPSVNPAVTTQALAALLESEIRDCPEQWMWFHPRWTERDVLLLSGNIEEPACAAR
jgi:Kdo2-lipid IVA lauroyltransferase/acyltransferase